MDTPRAESRSPPVQGMESERTRGRQEQKFKGLVRWVEGEHVQPLREPGGGRGKGTAVARATTLLGKMEKMGHQRKNQS